MTLVVTRVLMVTLLPLAASWVHTRIDKRPETQRWPAEVWMLYLLALAVGASGISGAFAHTFAAERTAESIGFPPGNPFQHEVAVANLVLATLAFGAMSRPDGFRDAVVVAVTVMGLGATAVHAVEAVQSANLAPGNTVQNFANLLRPAALIVVLRRTRSSTTPTMAGPWHSSVKAAVLTVTGVAWSGFAVAYALS